MKLHLNKIPVLTCLFLMLITAGCASPTAKQIKVDNTAAEVEAKIQRNIAFEIWIKSRERLNNVAYNIYTKPVLWQRTRTALQKK